MLVNCPMFFSECLTCGSTAHRFATRPDEVNGETRKVFWQELLAHISSARKRKSEPVLRFAVNQTLFR